MRRTGRLTGRDSGSILEYCLVFTLLMTALIFSLPQSESYVTDTLGNFVANLKAV